MKSFKSIFQKFKNKINSSQGATRYKWIKIGVYLGISVFVFGIIYNSFFSEDTWESKLGKQDIKIEDEDAASLLMSPVRTLNPIISKDEDVGYLTNLLYGSLFNLDESWTPTENLVEEFQFSEGKISLTLKDVKWEDGRELSGEDVDFTVSAIKIAGEGSPYFTSASKIKNVIYNGKNIEIDFKKEDDVSLNYLMFPILPKHKYKNAYSLKDTDENFIPLGSGAYKVKEYDKNKGLTLIPNENYFGKKARSKINISILENEESKYNFVESSRVSLLVTKDGSRNGKITKKGVKIKNIPANQMEFLSFNVNSPIMSNKSLRKAISFAVDVQSIIEEDYLNSAKANEGLFLNGYMGISSKWKDRFDKDKARQYLKKAGYEDRDEDGKVENEKDEKLNLSILVDESDVSRKSALEKISSSLESIGVDVKVEALENEELKGRLNSGNYDIAFVGMSFDLRVDYRSLLATGDRNNISFYSNKKVDEAFKNIYSGQKISEIKKNVEKIKKNIDEDTPYYCICYKTYGIVKAPVFSGDLNSTFENPYKGAETWYSTFKKSGDEK